MVLLIELIGPFTTRIQRRIQMGNRGKLVFLVLVFVVVISGLATLIRGCRKPKIVSPPPAVQPAKPPVVISPFERLNNLLETDPDGFQKGMEELLSKNPDIPKDETPLVKYLYGVYLWQSERRNEALPILRAVAERKPLPCLGFLSQQIPRGNYRTNLVLEKDEDPWLEDNVTLVIALIEVHTPKDMLVVNLIVRNPTDRKRFFFFPRTPDERRKKLEEAKDPYVAKREFPRNVDFYLIDNLGRKVTPVNQEPYFRSAPNWEDGGSFERNKICLEPFQEILERIAFQIDTRGVTSVRFGLPDQPDTLYWHKGVVFDPIELRKVKFVKFP